MEIVIAYCFNYSVYKRNHNIDLLNIKRKQKLKMQSLVNVFIKISNIKFRFKLFSHFTEEVHFIAQ